MVKKLQPIKPTNKIKRIILPRKKHNSVDGAATEEINPSLSKTVQFYNAKMALASDSVQHGQEKKKLREEHKLLQREITEAI